jgi:hypothetical protein
MAITRQRLQQIIKEEVARLLREADEGTQSAAETALSALQSAQYDNAVAAAMNRIDGDAASQKADALEGDLAALADQLGLEDKDPKGQASGLRKVADGLARASEDATAKSGEAGGALEQVAGVLGAVSGKVGGGEEEEGEEEEEPEAEEPEALAEGHLLERWNKLAFGRKLL